MDLITIPQVPWLHTIYLRATYRCLYPQSPRCWRQLPSMTSRPGAAERSVQSSLLTTSLLPLPLPLVLAPALPLPHPLPLPLLTPFQQVSFRKGDTILLYAQVRQGGNGEKCGERTLEYFWRDKRTLDTGQPCAMWEPSSCTVLHCTS